MVCSYHMRCTSEIIISYLFMKNSAKPTRGTIPEPNIILDPLPVSFCDALFLASISCIIAFETCSFSMRSLASFENHCFPSFEKKKSDPCVTSFYLHAFAKKKPSRLSLSLRRKLRTDIIIALAKFRQSIETTIVDVTGK